MGFPRVIAYSAPATAEVGVGLNLIMAFLELGTPRDMLGKAGREMELPLFNQFPTSI